VLLVAYYAIGLILCCGTMGKTGYGAVAVVIYIIIFVIITAVAHCDK